MTLVGGDGLVIEELREAWSVRREEMPFEARRVLRRGLRTKHHGEHLFEPITEHGHSHDVTGRARAGGGVEDGVVSNDPLPQSPPAGDGDE